MKTLHHILGTAAAVWVALACSPTPASAQTDRGASNTLRIMSYNVFNGKQVDGKTFNYDRQVSVIRGMNPDVITIDEVDSITRRSEGHYLLREYAEKLGLHYFYSPTIDFQGGKYGMGLMAKKHPLRVTRVVLPGQEEKRTLILAEYPEYIIASTHFSLRTDDQKKSIDIVRSFGEIADKPLIIAGDLNFKPNSDAGRYFAKFFRILTDTAKHTFPANEPTETIDYIAVYKSRHASNIVLLRSGVLGEAQASDHRPVYADIRFALPAAEVFHSEPYLQNFAPNAVSVMYQTNAVVHTWVEYGTDTASTKTARTLLAGQEPCFDIENKVRITGLEPGKTYHYRVCAQEVLLNEAYRKILGDTVKTKWHTFSLPTADTQKFTAIVFNDLHERDDIMNKLVSIVKSNGIDYDLVLFNGDCVPEPRDRAHAITRVNVLMRGVDAADKHTIIIRGNHEIRNSYSAGMLSLTDNFDGKTYGAFSWGDTRFVILDCGEDKPDNFWVYYGLNDFSQLHADQKAFLEKELKSKEYKKAKRHILINHIPIWGTADVYTDNHHPWTAMWSPLLEKAGFDIDLTAHAHKHYVFEKGQQGNPMPIVAGGGPETSGSEMATVTVLQKDGKQLRLRVFSLEGKVLVDRNL